MRSILAALAIAASTVPATAGELDGKWRIQNGNVVIISGSNWSVTGYSNGSYKTTTGSIRKTGANRYEITGDDVRAPRTCSLKGNLMSCTFGTSFRRVQ